ncbi:3-deoxy-D-manno-octulosonic-acid transferase [Rhodovulum sp. P5]|uniref:3-deoxy-D-manno-octulosonic acid transferase n=1 Tax=Rhodovulum sp. P5 TaxID=1564506 RepID=UPI0009C2E945|nr:glycosyltransferase N-terminal domain-containing protein [Rhodovulum sp. P5]ARE41423.1 3-deoxy-D-manno-octulosonic-acid transferase [Rhodovulum sp. P5]
MAGHSGSNATRPNGPLVWVHAPPPDAQAEVAELLRQLDDRDPDLTILVTGQNSVPDWPASLPDLPDVLCAAGPGEGLRPSTAFLDRWRPDIALFYPAHLPASTLSYAGARGTALFLILPDIPKAWRSRWRIGAVANRQLLNRFDRIFVTAPDGAAQLAAMGLPRDRIATCKPLSRGSAVLRCNSAERGALGALIAGRPVWLAACTRPAEDPVVVAAHARVLRHAHRLLLILVPSDPERGADLARRLRAEGWLVALRSDNEEPEAETQIYVADQEGEMGLWLRLAPVSFLGGTLGANDGPDPFQAAALGSAILHGPALGPYADRYNSLGDAMAARLVRDEISLAEALSELLAPDRAAVMARNAWDISTEGTKSTDRIVERMLDVLSESETA